MDLGDLEVEWGDLGVDWGDLRMDWADLGVNWVLPRQGLVAKGTNAQIRNPPLKYTVAYATAFHHWCYILR